MTNKIDFRAMVRSVSSPYNTKRMKRVTDTLRAQGIEIDFKSGLLRWSRQLYQR